MNFVKMQGAGNDYVVIKAKNGNQNWSKLAIAVCDRHYGIGADSLLVLLPSARADFKMRIFDTDGSEAEACGNGIRCLAKYAYDRGLIVNGSSYITVETVSGVKKIQLFKRNGGLVRIQANMGEPRFAASEIPVIVKPGDKVVYIKSMISYPVTVGGVDLILNLVSMGNPHGVYFWERPVAEFPMERLGPVVEHLSIFPNRLNFEVARVLSPIKVEARVWERGVGETLACGTGACAITVAAQLLGYAEPKLDVALRGGVLEVERIENGELLLSGPAEMVFEGKWTKEV